jgi:hypothetical protein
MRRPTNHSPTGQKVTTKMNMHVNNIPAQTAHHIENENGALMSLMQKVADQAARSADYLAPTNDLQKSTSEDGAPQMIIEAAHGEPTKILDINSVAFGQLANHADIDVRTAKRLQANYPAEFDALLNAHFEKEPKRKMLRTFAGGQQDDPNKGILRAFVSDRFKTFDNVNLLQSSLPQLMDSEAKWRVVSADISERRMYLRLKSEVQTGTGSAVGDLMANGIGLSNSEVGSGSISVFQIAWTLACLNGMQTQNKNRTSHLTSARDTGDWQLLSDEAKAADNHSLELKVRDLVGAYASRLNFDEVLDQMRSAANDIIEGEAVDVTEVVGNLGKVMSLSKKENTAVLNGLMATIGQSGFEQDKPLSRATLVNAVTACAHRSDIDDVDVWQQRGGALLTMPQRDWNRIAA